MVSNWYAGVCECGGRLVSDGRTQRCDKCGKTPAEAAFVRRMPCEVYSRIVGYVTPVGLWNRGKQQEFRERVVYEPTERKERK